MLDVVFINLISAGLEKLCRRPGDAGLPPDTAVSGAQLIRELLATSPEATGRLINRCVEDLWRCCRSIELPAEIAEPHLAELPALIRQADLADADRQIILSQPDAVTGHKVPSGISSLAQRIITSDDTTSLDLVSDGLDETIIAYLLEAFLKCLTESHDEIMEIQPLLDDLLFAPPAKALAPHPEPPPAKPSLAAATLAKMERADALEISVALLDVITVSLINLTKSASIREADLVAAAADARTLITALQQLGERLPPGPDELFAQALNQFRSGRIADCDQALASAEDFLVKRSMSVAPRETDMANMAIDVRGIRADVQALTGTFIKAARHNGFAQRYIPRADYETRWHYAEREARYYELAAFQRKCPDGLEQAARTCTSALAVMPSHEPLETRARAQAELGRILLLLGEQEQQPSRFELAAQLLTDAQAFYAAQPDCPGHVGAAAYRADAFTRLGEFHRSTELLEQAAFLYQSVIQAITSDNLPPRDPERAPATLDINARMALSLSALADITRSDRTRDAAVTIIIAKLPEILPTPLRTSGFSRCILVARCHTALANWHVSNGEQPAATAHYERAAQEYARAGIDLTAQSLRLRAENNQSPAQTLTVTGASAA